MPMTTAAVKRDRSSEEAAGTAQPTRDQPSADAAHHRGIRLLPHSVKAPHAMMAAIATSADLSKRLEEPPATDADRTRVYILVAQANHLEWDLTTGTPEDQDALARGMCVSWCIVDVDAVPEAAALVSSKQAATTTAPTAHVFKWRAGHSTTTNGGKWHKQSEKEVHGPIDLTSLLCIEPVHDLGHLHRRIAEADARGVTFLITYSGAVWCPPCRNIMPAVPGIVDSLNAALKTKNVSAEVVKLDRDAAESVDLVYGVEYIPMFHVFRCSDIAQHADCCGADLASVKPDEVDEEAWKAQLSHWRAKVLKPVASLQNSNTSIVSEFLVNHCTPLTFDEDF